jgi:serine/threonine protein kinase
MIPDYRLLSLVGEGSFGEVWLAHTVTREFRAVKIIRRGDFDSEKHYWREFNGIKQYEPVSRQHPGLIPVLHVGCNDQAGFYYYVMEAADDQEVGRAIQADAYRPRSLASELVKRPRLSLAECVSMSLALSDALEFLHGKELVHRDIKPSNVIYVDHAPKLADIGLVTAIDRNRTQRTNLGTEGFIPPELHGLPAADIYSLGKLMYEACMGLDRFRFPELPASLVERSGSAEFFALNRIILKACESDARRRYPNAGELRADLLDLQRILPPVQGH